MDNNEILLALRNVVKDVMQEELTPIKQQLDKVDQRLDKIEQRLDKVEQRLDQVEERLNILEENTEIIKTATNELIGWTEIASGSIQIPFMETHHEL